MARREPAGTVDAPFRARRRAAAGAWAVFAIVVWNVVFDGAVLSAGRDYLTRQALHQQGLGPPVTIPQVMSRGIALGARRATEAGGAVAACGAFGIWLATRRRKAELAGPAE